MLEVILLLLSARGNPVTLVSKADGLPRFCGDYRNSPNRHLVRNTWPMPNNEFFHLDAEDGAKFIMVARCARRWATVSFTIPKCVLSVHSDHLNEPSLVGSDGKLFTSIVSFFPGLYS